MSNFRPHDYADVLRQEDTYASDSSVMYRWNKVHWEPLDEKFCERLAYEWLVRHDRTNASQHNARAANDAAILWVPPIPTPSSELVIPCQNGYVLVRDAELTLLEPHPKFGMRYALSCEFNAEYPAPTRFLTFLERVLPDADVRARVQEYAGYTLTADARYQKAQLWIGRGANGKGVLANIVQALHGNVAAINLDELDGFRLSILVGASLIYCDEIPRRHINEQVLKSLIAGERILIDRKYRDPLSIHILGKWLVLGNHMPSIADHSFGFWRRWDVVPFEVTIPESEQNPLLTQSIIEHELTGVLNWALEGLLRLQKRGTFDPVLPRKMKDALHDARVETNSVHGWFEEEEISCSDTANSTKEDVYIHYSRWCARNKIVSLNTTQFWTRVREMIPYQEIRTRTEGRQVRCCNIRLP